MDLTVTQSIPDEPPNIEFVAQNAGPAERVAAERRVAPWTAARARCALSVEFGHDPARALARCEVRKDATNDCRLGLDDLAATALTVFDDGVTIRKSSTRTALFDAAAQPTARFVGEVLKEEGVHSAFEPDMQFTDFPLRRVTIRMPKKFISLKKEATCS